MKLNEIFSAVKHKTWRFYVVFFYAGWCGGCVRKAEWASSRLEVRSVQQWMTYMYSIEQGALVPLPQTNYSFIIPVTVFGYLFLISRDFFVFCLVLVLIERTYQTRKTVFERISKNLKFVKKCSATHRIFNSLLLRHVVKHGGSCLIYYLVVIFSLEQQGIA